MHGSFAFLAYAPISFLIFDSEMVFLGIVLALRGRFEGRPYNPAYSSWLGIQLLIAILVDAAYTLQHVEPSGFIATASFQWIFGGIATLYALWRLTIYDNPADKYHQLVVMPLLIWLLGTTVPFLWSQGYLQKSFVVVVLGMFAALIIIDRTTGRSKPRQYMTRIGVHLKGNYPTT